MNMKRLSYLAGLLGLTAAIALVVHEGWSTICDTIDHDNAIFHHDSQEQYDSYEGVDRERKMKEGKS